MDGKLGESPTFLVFDSGAESHQNSPVFTFSLLLLALVADLPFFFPRLLQ
jgi:hypothetical protein